MSEIISAAEKLASLLKESEEYRAYWEAKAAAFGDEPTAVLLREYRRLQLKIQASELSGGADEEELEKLQKMGELLQLNPVSSEYLFAQYRLNSLLGSVYKLLAKAVDADLSMIDD